ncbi:MAG TPA: hypothetical protein PKC39_10240 [Ferruginibacter sp.]|nr:hypothetical protein [Ferruginibacter sp.]HMP21329.1 hypothetical protein [Ferruginibacter sp.]
MKPKIKIIAVFVLLGSFAIQCNERSAESTLTASDTTAQAGTMASERQLHLPWLIDTEYKTKKRNSFLKSGIYTAGHIVAALNAKYPEVQLLQPAMLNDTLWVKIDNSNYLTQQMGSSGAASYLADIVINLTAIDGVNYVKIDFEEGSHAAPGTWTKKDFADFKEIAD